MQSARNDELVTRLAQKAVPVSGTYDRPFMASRLPELHRLRDEHPIWRGRFMRLFAAGAFSKDDLKFIFGQYYHYSKNFTRYITALMTRLPDDFYRSRLSQNLWDEGGGAEPEQRHAQLYRDFLDKALGLDDFDDIPCESFTAKFVSEYIDACLSRDPVEAAAFLSLGTESIVPRMYSVFVQGLRRAGIPDEALKFFHIHIAVDDEHAVTLEQLMCSYAHEAQWFDKCAQATNRALELRQRFFDDLLRAVQFRRVHDMVEKVQDHTSLAPPPGEEDALLQRWDDQRAVLYENVDERLCVEFEVRTLPFKMEVLDPRIVKIAPHRRNERHRHAHETFYYILQGEGRIAIDGTVLHVKAGDMAFVPRWCLHQTANDGDEPMLVLAVTDYHFSSKAHLGDHNPRWKQPARVAAP